jgi:protein-L-isoaspartate(D-aspartate) O-methyltransferase
MGDGGPRIASAQGRAHHALVRTATDRALERDQLARAVAASTGVHDPRVLDAFRSVPREAFLPPDLVPHAYEDRALPIGAGQTISQPSMIALMLAALEPVATDHALEVGAGSGYAAALLGKLTASVRAVEIVPELALRARKTLSGLGTSNVDVELGNGAAALTGGPFDVILVSAAAREVPSELLAELAPGGRIAIPVGDEDGQHLLKGHRNERGEITWGRGTACVFVPLLGA